MFRGPNVLPNGENIGQLQKRVSTKVNNHAINGEKHRWPQLPEKPHLKNGVRFIFHETISLNMPSNISRKRTHRETYMKRWRMQHPPIQINLNRELYDWLKKVTSETGQSYTGFITQLLMRYKDLDREIETKAKEIAEKMYNEEKAKLNEWLKEKATEIYERGRKDGYDKGYNDGFIDGFKVALMDIQSGNINTYALSEFKITEYTTAMQICNTLYYSPSQCPLQ